MILFEYILKQVETSPDAVFTETELIRISQDSFHNLKKQKYLQFIQYDPEKEPYYSSIPDDNGNERFVRKIKGQYYAYSTEDSNIDRIALTKEDITRWSFNIQALLKDIKSKNKLSKNIDNINPRTYFIGEKNKKFADKKVGVFLCLFADNKQAEIELLSLKSKIPQYNNILILCPSFTITSQNLLKQLENHAINCMCFKDILKDNDFVIDFKLLESTPIPELKPSSKKPLVKFPTPPDTKWEDVTIQIVSNDSIKITANSIHKRFTYAEIGFKDGRKGDLPDKQWDVLKDFAEANGEIAWGSPKAQLKLQKKIQTIRKRLQAIMSIDDDPFYPYRTTKSYKTKFKIEDKSYH